jgi:hemerythrin-like domain-containing protein
MKTATKNLENDHVQILRLIDVMEQIIQEASPNEKHIEEIIDLIKNYADGFHHSKEENMLFPMMLTKGFSTQQGPVAVMLSEHTQGRNFVKGMVDHLAKYIAGDKTVLPQICYHMQGYIDLLRNHIAKENNVLFPMADRVLSEGEQESLLVQFEKVENSNVCGNILATYVLRIDLLAQEYPVKQPISN